MLTQREIADHVEITQVLQRYFDALDAKAYERLDGVFTPDARLDYAAGDMKTDPLSYPEMAAIFRQFNQVFAFTQHHMSHPLIELAGDEARSTTTLRALHVQETLDGTRNVWVVYGTYRDAYVRTAEGWRIRKRIFRSRHTEGQLLGPDSVRLFPTASED